MAIRVFSKNKWLDSASEQVRQGVLSEREVVDAENNWVNDLDGKTEEELIAAGHNCLNENWFEER